MTFDEIFPLLIKGERVKCEDWGDDEFIWRVPCGDSYPDWFDDYYTDKSLMFYDRSLYDERGDEVFAVTIIENVDNNWELFDEVTK